ncbi:MAG: CmcJ/NvfI family oxidoreductase [Gammaproteobacteria bacterium]|nr:CmcJ/NvfI family oxidoreductase [Gammaproteobacteria bacterium]
MSNSSPAVDGAAADNAVRAAITFIVPQKDKPRFESAALTGGEPRIHFGIERHEVTIADMRPVADQLTLEREGFLLLRHATQVEDLYDDDLVESVYRGETEQLLREATGARRAVIFDFTRRSDGPGGARNPDGLRGPATRAHADYTARSGPVRARDVLGAEAVEEALARGGHVEQINVWRPITGPVLRAPLALADASSVAPAELVATDQLFPDRTGEIYTLAYGARQRWYWAPRMQRDEVLLIKGWDSRDGARARSTPHAAFELPGQDPQGPPRESIEVRAYLLYDD